MKNSVEFKVHGRYALFTDPLTRSGGEKSTYHLPTYEGLKGILKSIYWKPTLIWIVDRVRVMKAIRTQAKNMKTLKMSGGNDLAIYTYLAEVEYQVQAHFEWNRHRPDLAKDRIDGKHYQTALRMIDRGGRQDVFLGTRECQGYVEPCAFGDGQGAYDGAGELAYGVMFHGYDYPDETGVNELSARFFRPTVRDGVLEFPLPELCTVRTRIRAMTPNPPRMSGIGEVKADELA